MRSTFQDRRSSDSLPALFMSILPALVISAVSRTHASHGCVKFTLSSGHSICACKPCVRCSQHTGGMFFRF
jgi:hypothetical protein